MKPDAALGPAVSGPQNAGAAGLTLHLVSLGRLHLQQGEVVPVLLHRHMLVLYLVWLALLTAFDSTSSVRDLPVEQRGPVYMLALGMTMWIIGLCLKRALARAARRGQVGLHLSPVLFMATALGILSAETLGQMVAGSGQRPLYQLLLILGSYYLLAEVSTTIAAHKLVPLILAELRGLPIRTLDETDPALWPWSAPTPAETETAPAPEPVAHPAEQPPDPAPPALAAPAVEGTLVTADRTYPLASLMHLQAYGNYVHLWARDRHDLLPGPLSNLVGQLPDDLGKQVHRSHWVAASALVDWRVAGRDITLRLGNGHRVPVATTRSREVRDWLNQLGLPQRDAP